MTGAYLRAKRDGKWENIEVEHLTPAERREKLASRDMEEVMRWLDLLCESLVEAEKMFNQLEAEGILEKASRP